MQDYFGVFQLLSDHIHVAGWIILIIFAWRASARFTKFTSGVTTAESQAKASSETLEVLATNHLPHLQKGMDDLNDNIKDMREEIISELKGVRSDLLQYALRKD